MLHDDPFAAQTAIVMLVFASALGPGLWLGRLTKRAGAAPVGGTDYVIDVSANRVVDASGNGVIPS